MSEAEKKSGAAPDNRDKERKNENPLNRPVITFGYEFMTDEKMAELGFGNRNGIYSQLRDDVIYLLKSTKSKGDKKLVIFPKAENNEEVNTHKLHSLATLFRLSFKKAALPYNVSVLARRKALAFMPKTEEKTAKKG